MCSYFTTLQSILNVASHLIGGMPKVGHISVFIRDSLHWLPIQQRILFNTISITRNGVIGVAPTYLRFFCTFVSSLSARASLPSSTRDLLVIPRMLSVTAQSRSFVYVGPWAYNSLPESLRMGLLSLFLLFCWNAFKLLCSMVLQALTESEIAAELSRYINISKRYNTFSLSLFW